MWEWRYICFQRNEKVSRKDNTVLEYYTSFPFYTQTYTYTLHLPVATPHPTIHLHIPPTSSHTTPSHLINYSHLPTHPLTHTLTITVTTSDTFSPIHALTLSLPPPPSHPHSIFIITLYIRCVGRGKCVKEQAMREECGRTSTNNDYLDHIHTLSRMWILFPFFTRDHNGHTVVTIWSDNTLFLSEVE